MRVARPATGQPLPRPVRRPATGPAQATTPTADTAERAQRRRARGDPAGPEQRPVLRQVRGADLGDAAGRGRLPGLALHDAPGAARGRAVPGTTQAATHPARVKPELLATRPGQVWSWDITKLRGPERGVYYDRYVILDIYSRYVVGWTVAAREDADIAKDMIKEAMTVHGRPGSLHADRGTSMTSKPVAQLLVDLGVTRSHSRPHVSNDNPFSEAAFKTLKYAPVFPDRFGCLADARAFCEQFFSFYNHEHRHSGIGLHTPASVHHGTAVQVRAHRAVTLDAAYAAHPDRFRRPPVPPRLPAAAWINQPSREALIQNN